MDVEPNSNNFKSSRVQYRKEMHFERRSGTPASATPPLANEHVSFVDASEIGVVLREHGRCADNGIGRSEHT